MNRKKRYSSPIIELIKIDQELSLLLSSENTGPEHPGAESVSSHNESSTSIPNKFNENPFEK